ncbi:MAG: Mur ligase family protein, partial [Flavobacteriaceae bacterium]
MTYNQAIDWLFKVPLSFNRDFHNYKLKLEPVIDFCNRVDNPQSGLKIIHVAGTNGKGSTCHITASIIQEHGKNVGIFSSPHLIDFRERIKINGKYIDKRFVTNFINKHKSYIEENKISFFEISFVMSLCYFRDSNVDYSLIEVGLGGRLDATNICNPIVSCITNIGYDHKNFLGKTLEKIALEKAGIIKSETPIVVGEGRKTLVKVFYQISLKLNSPIIYSNNISLDKEYGLHGDYQLDNIKNSIAIVSLIKELNLDNDKINLGITKTVVNTRFFGRWQIIKSKPLVIFDVAHNIDAIKKILKQLKEEDKDIRFVFGTLNKPGQIKILDILQTDYFYYFCETN